MRPYHAVPMLCLVAVLSLKPSSSDQALWLLYPQLMDNKGLETAKTNASTINIH